MQLITNLEEMGCHDQHQRKQVLLDHVLKTNASVLANKSTASIRLRHLRADAAPAAAPYNPSPGIVVDVDSFSHRLVLLTGEFVEVCADALQRFFGVSHNLLTDVRKLAADGITHVPPRAASGSRLRANDAESDDDNAIAPPKERRETAHIEAVRACWANIAEPHSSKGTDSSTASGDAFVIAYPSVNRQRVRELCQEYLRTAAARFRAQVGDVFFAKHNYTQTFKVFSQPSFNSFLKRCFPHLRFHKHTKELSQCSECVIFESALRHCGGDSVAREALEHAQRRHYAINSNNRLIFQLVAEIAVRSPYNLLWVCADQGFPGWVPEPAKVPKHLQRDRGVPLELLAVVLSDQTLGHPFKPPGHSPATVFTYLPPAAAAWPSVPGVPAVCCASLRRASVRFVFVRCARLSLCILHAQLH
jgi:hypothetical protein